MLETLSVKNFKSLKDELFHLNNLTIFSGLNCMGKSSVIQSLLLLRQSFEKNMLPDKGLSLVGDYVKIGNGSDILSIDAEDEHVEYDVTWSDSSLALTFKYKPESNLQALERKSVDGDCYGESLFTSSFQYLSAERISPKSSFDVSDYDVNDLNSLGITGEYTAHFIAEKGLGSLPILALQHPLATSETLISSINAWMSEITPGTRVVAKVIPEINQASLHYQFTTSDHLTKIFRPENTGFGLTFVLPVVTAILNAKPGDLILIENPEAHLHPAGQSAVARLIALAAENGVQVLIETHSDHFLNGIRTSVKNCNISSGNVSLYYFSRDIDAPEHSVQIDEPRIDKTGKIDHWPAGFFDEWDKNLDELLDVE